MDSSKFTSSHGKIGRECEAQRDRKTLKITRREPFVGLSLAGSLGR